MKEYKFEIYYKYDGSTQAEFFEGEKSLDEIQDELVNFVNEIPHRIKSSNLTISSSMPINDDRERRLVSIKTDANKNEVIEAVEKWLEGSYLKGKIL